MRCFFFPFFFWLSFSFPHFFLLSPFPSLSPPHPHLPYLPLHPTSPISPPAIPILGVEGGEGHFSPMIYISFPSHLLTSSSFSFLPFPPSHLPTPPPSPPHLPHLPTHCPHSRGGGRGGAFFPYDIYIISFSSPHFFLLLLSPFPSLSPPHLHFPYLPLHPTSPISPPTVPILGAEGGGLGGEGRGIFPL